MKYRLLLTLLLVLTAQVRSFEWMPSLRVSSVYLNSRLLRQIYRSPRLAYEFEGVIACTDRLGFWGNVSYFSKGGRPPLSEETENVTIIPASVGMKYFFHFNSCMDIYVGLGGSYTFFTREDATFERSQLQGVGFVTKLGLTYYLTDYVFVDLFVDYYNTHVRGHLADDLLAGEKKRLDVGSFHTGVGFGWDF